MKKYILPLLIISSMSLLACGDPEILVISCRGGVCDDVAVNDPNARDSDEGNHNTTDPDLNDPVEEPLESDDPDEPVTTETCTGTDDCADVPESCDICTVGNRKCDGNSLLVCRKNTKGCLDWTVQDTCQPSESWCNSTTLACEDCSESCNVGDYKCTESGIAQCEANGHGCRVWTLKTPCDNDSHCDEITMSCVAGCASVCHENDRKCDKNNIMTCRKNDLGCMNWEVESTCNDGELCVGTAPSCEKSCGAECEPFSIVLMPDTQHYVLSSNGIQKKQTQWIVDNQKKENIRMVIHLGDVSDGNTKTHYERAVAAQNVLVEAGVPFTITTGNHDYKKGATGVEFVARDRSIFPKYFNDAYFQKGYHDSSWFGGFYQSANMYATFNVGHLKFAVIALEFFPRKDALCWADNLIANKLRDHYIIIATHGYLTNDASKSSSGKYASGSNGDIPFGSLGTDMWSEFVSRHSNIIMVACGHVSDSEHRIRMANNGNAVVEMLVDYQSEKPCTSDSCQASSCGAKTDGGNGWMRILRIDPVNVMNGDGTLKHNVTATTFSVLDEYQNSQKMFCSSLNADSKYHYYDKTASQSDHNFSFAFDFSTPLDYHYSDNGSLSFISRNVNEIENDTTDGNQYHPAIAMNRTTGAFVSVWEDDWDNDGVRDIKGRLFCPGGCADTRQFTVSSGAGDMMNPDVAMDAKGNFVVVWQNSSQIFMRGYDYLGKERIPERKISNSSNQSLPAIAMNSDGDFVIAWQDSTYGSDLPQVYMRGFHADGSEMIAEKNILETIDGRRQNPAIAMADDGSFVITWEDDADMNDVWQINAKGFASDGSERIAEFTVNSVAPGQQLNPAIGMNQSGTFYIAFEDDNDGNGKYLIIARGFDKNGKQIKADTTLSGADEKAADPTVCVAEDGTAVFGWTAKALNDSDVQKRTISGAFKTSSEAAIPRLTAGPQHSPDVACTADGKHVFVYSDDKVKSGFANIHARGF